MHQRFLFWLLLGAFFLCGPLRAQTPTLPEPGLNDPMPEGTVLVAKVTGGATKTVNGVTVPLTPNMRVEQKAKINTAAGASVVLVFSNGASTRIEADSELIIEEFLQDPFPSQIKVAELEREPSASRTKLFLNRGEIVGDVKTLKPGGRASFTVQTPVGAAGIRGTIFRIVFRPSGTGQAFFTLSTVEGQVDYISSSGGTTTTTTTTATASGNVAGLEVPQGQEVSFDVNVTTDAQGQLVVTVLPPPPSATTQIPAGTMQAATDAARDIAVAVQNTVFTPPAPASTPDASSAPPSGSTTGPSGEGESSGTQQSSTTTTTQTSEVSGSNAQTQFTGTATSQSTTTTNPAPAAIPQGQLPNTSEP